MALALFPLLFSACHESDPVDRSSWVEQEIRSDASFRDIFFLDAERGWIVGGGFGVDGGILGETQDGGISWRFRTGIVPNPRSRLFHLNAVHFQDEARGFIAADGGRILRTVDAGGHWHTQVHAGRRLAALFFLDQRTGWAAGEQWILRTQDAGSNWVPIHGNREDDRKFRATAIHFIDPDHGWLVGHHGAVWRTRDGGTTWEPIDASLTDPSVRLSAVQFVDSDWGWIVGSEGTIAMTRDGGATWTHHELDVDADLTDVHFVDRHQGWIVGYDPARGESIVLHSDDGGANWKTQAMIEGEALQTLEFQSNGRGWAAGDRVREKPQRLLRYVPASP